MKAFARPRLRAVIKETHSAGAAALFGHRLRRERRAISPWSRSLPRRVTSESPLWISPHGARVRLASHKRLPLGPKLLPGVQTHAALAHAVPGDNVISESRHPHCVILPAAINPF